MYVGNRFLKKNQRNGLPIYHCPVEKDNAALFSSGVTNFCSLEIKFCLLFRGFLLKAKLIALKNKSLVCQKLGRSLQNKKEEALKTAVES